MLAQEMAVKVVNITAGAPDIRIFELVATEGAVLPCYEPGSHIDVLLPQSVVRQYSVCSRPNDDHLRIAVKLEANSRGGSRHLHEGVSIGDTLTISTPRNNFAVDWTATHQILVAGGIGVTPLLAMAHHMMERHSSFEFHYFIRSTDSAAFVDEIAEAFGARVKLHLGKSPGEVEAIVDAIVGAASAETHIYACGPKPMIDLVVETAGAAMPARFIHSELFAAGDADISHSGEAFTVTLASSGQSFLIPQGKSIAEVLNENGVPVPVSCEQGVCGTCLTGVLEGVPDHRDEILSSDVRAEGSIMALCVSRALTDKLLLDI